MNLFEKNDFLQRIQFAVSENIPITLIVGSPISYNYGDRKGVLDVSGIIEIIRTAYCASPDALERLDDVLRQKEVNAYQKAFEYVLATRGIQFANKLIRRAVMNSTSDQSADRKEIIDISDDDWYLPPAVESLGELLAKMPEKFGSRIITTNFDPLLEVSIRRAGGQCFSSHYHRDGSPSTTSAEGVNVIHLHGFWVGTDTLHTPHQLRQNRPQLKNYLLDIFRKTLVVVVAYGGWDDVVGSAIEEVVLEDTSDPELLWAFKSSELTHLQTAESRLLTRLQPGIDRGRVQLYGGVDCHQLFADLAHLLIPAEVDKCPLEAPRRVLSEQEKALANVVGLKTERPVDATPRIIGFVGRDAELRALQGADASVICISGIGGQGKSALAAKLLTTFGEYAIADWRDCREEGNTAQTAIALFLQRISNDEVVADSLATASHKELVDLLLRYGSHSEGVLVLDNVDTYIDIDQQRPIGVIGVLCEKLLEANVRIKVILTCRPLVQIAHSRFFGLPLTGLDVDSSKELFKNKSAGHNLEDADCATLMHLTDGHPLYLSMLAAQKLSTGKSVSEILAEVSASRSDVPAMILRSTYKLLKPEQMEVIRLLAELERPEHDSVLEDLTGQRYNRLSKSLRRLKDLSLILERQDLSNKTLVDLHPLVRQFLRREYPKKDRDTFVGRVIIYFDRRLALVAKMLGKGRISKSVLDVWTHKIEILCNHSDWNVAISELEKIEPELGRAGLGEEYARLGLKIFEGVDWVVAIDEVKEFRKLINGVCHELSHHADHAVVERWAGHYHSVAGARGADRLNMLEFMAFDAWLRKDYKSALELARSAADLSKQIDVSLRSAPTHTLALVLRDSGEIDSALDIFLEGLTVDEALAEQSGKSAEFFGNIGRSFHLKGDYDLALKFYKRSGKEMLERPRDFHNSGWLRFWVGQVFCKTGRVAEGYAFLCAAKHIWTTASKLLETSADQAIGELRKMTFDVGDDLIPEWKAEQMFAAWLSH